MEVILPFDEYPGRGRERLGPMTNERCRTGYGMKFIEITGQRACAYCGMNLWNDYDDWKFMTLDHVVPQAACKELQIPATLLHDYSNAVLACMTCNGFDNRFWDSYRTFINGRTFDTPEKFWDLRDEIFPLRKRRIAEKVLEDRRFHFTLNPAGSHA